MTVSQLIEILQQHDPNAEVWLDWEHLPSAAVTGVRVGPAQQVIIEYGIVVA